MRNTTALPKHFRGVSFSIPAALWRAHSLTCGWRPSWQPAEPNEKLNIVSSVPATVRPTSPRSATKYRRALRRERKPLGRSLKNTHKRKVCGFSKLYDDSKDFDAVVVAITEHTHALRFAAIKLGKHVYCENRWRTTSETRLPTEAAAKAKITTQMGTQMHAQDNFRRVVELIQAGAIGPVSEAHVWVSRAWGGGVRPAETEPVPSTLHWDLWLGPAPERPFHSSYISGQPKWYPYWDFGGGTLPDLGSHWNDLPFWALKLRHPLTIEAHGPPVSSEKAPASYHITYEYGARGDMPPVKSPVSGRGQARSMPTSRFRSGTTASSSSALGMLLADYNKHTLPDDKFADFNLPSPPSPNIGHWKNGSRPARPAADTTISITRTADRSKPFGKRRLSNRQKSNGTRSSCKPRTVEAARFIRAEYRKGWTLG
jgi:hypothetical protein